MRVVKNIFCLILVVFICVSFTTISFGQTKKLKVIVTVANVRDNPGMSGKVIATVPEGTTLDISSQSGNWFLVTFKTADGIQLTGYIHYSTVEMVREEANVADVSQEEYSRKKPKSKKNWTGFTVRISGGMDYLLDGDVNQNINGRNQFHQDFYDNRGFPVDSDLNLVRYGLDISGYLVYQITPCLGIGIGGGYLKASSSSKTSYVGGDAGYWQLEPSISAIPILLSFSYNLMVNRKISLLFQAGGGIYLVKYDFKWYAYEEGWWERFDEEAEGVGTGFHGAIALEYLLGKRIGLSLEILGRYAKISDFEGSKTYDDYHNDDGKISGSLYYYQAENNDGNRYYIMGILEDPFTDPEVTNPRKGEVDFTGIGLKIGIFIRF